MIINPGDSNPVNVQTKIEGEKQKKDETIGDKTTKIANKALHSELKNSLQTKADRLEVSVSADSSDDPVAEKTDQVGVDVLSDDDSDFDFDAFSEDNDSSSFKEVKSEKKQITIDEEKANVDDSKLEIEEKNEIEQEQVETKLEEQETVIAQEIMDEVGFDLASVTRDIAGVAKLSETIQKFDVMLENATTEIQDKFRIIKQIVNGIALLGNVDPNKVNKDHIKDYGIAKDSNTFAIHKEVLAQHGHPTVAVHIDDLTPDQLANLDSLQLSDLSQHLVKSVQVMTQNDQNQALKLIQTHLFLKNQIQLLTNLLNEIKDQIKNSKPQQKPTEHHAETHVEHEKTPPKHKPQKHDIEKIIITNHLMSDVKGLYNKKRQRVHDDKKDEEFQRIKEAKIEKKLKSDRLTDENIKSDHLKRENKIQSEKKQK